MVRMFGEGTSLGRSSRLSLKCDGTRAETRFRLSAKRMSPFKSAGASVQSTTGSLGVRISGSNAGYTMFRGSVKSTGYPLHSPVSPSLPLLCVTVYHHISNGLDSILNQATTPSFHIIYCPTRLDCPAKRRTFSKQPDRSGAPPSLVMNDYRRLFPRR